MFYVDWLHFKCYYVNIKGIEKMNNHCILYYYDKKESIFEKLQDFCKKQNLLFLECSNINIFTYLIKNISPMFVIINNKTLPKDFIIDFAKSNARSYIYTTQFNFIEDKNIFTFNNCSILENHIINQIKYSISTNNLTANQINERIYKELNTLGFSSKLIGLKYIRDIILYLATNPFCQNGRFSKIYSYIALQYNTNPINIERDVRFSISQAYTNSKQKQLFFDISKKDRRPTIKEIACHLTDKICLTNIILP